MGLLVANVLSPADRRRALRTGAGVVAAVGALDGLLHRSPERCAIWMGWAALLLGASEVVVRVRPAWLRAVGATAAVLSSVALAALVLASGGSVSPLFGVLPLIPALGAIIAPDNDEVSPVLAAAFPVAGVAILAVEGRSFAWIALWTVPVLLSGILVVRFSRQHRARNVAAARAAEERADALDRLARSERELARIERLARLPLLADGVAHDLNSPLAVVASTIAFARVELRDAGPELVEALNDAASAATRMRRIVGDLQRLARLELQHDGGSGAPAPATELALRDAVRFVATQLAQAAAVRAEIPDGLPVPIAPRHAVIDLVVQMVRALATAGGGEIVVRAERGGEGLTLAARRTGPALDASATIRSDPHVSVCRAYVEGLGGTFRSACAGGELQLAALLPVLKG